MLGLTRRDAVTVILAAAAGGLGWGIRGQYGHETGAMIAGLLVGLVCVWRFVPNAPSLHGARVAALTTVAISFGGMMTYGQTVGLTQDAPLRGHHAALAWGMLGLFLKGGVWIGLAAVFLGMGLSEVRYRTREIVLLLVGMTALLFLGVFVVNEPFDPASRELPWLYFSDHWDWEPDVDKPRRERWGGLAFALVGCVAYARAWRGDRLAGRLAIFGVVAGGLGFSLGQSFQSFHAWHPEVFQSVLGDFDAKVNYWNWMETIFGATAGAGLALGLAL
ncbi:MAG: hypothetical protein AAF517_06855, partial [Planctomycetota bacterium]